MSRRADRTKPQGLPELVVEIVSQHSYRHDMTTKFKLYETFGIPELWVVFPSDGLVNVYRHSDGIYQDPQPFSLLDEIPLEGIIDGSFALYDVFDPYETM
jgi:Uma2 family endonuclease